MKDSDKKLNDNHHCEKTKLLSKNTGATISAQIKQGIKTTLRKHESGAGNSSTSDSE